MMRAALAATMLVGACAPGAVRPADVRVGEDACAHCRMTIVSTQTAAQIVSPGAEPIFFDDLGCLRDSLARQPLAAGAVVFAADRTTLRWIDARTAVFTRTEAQTPMGSGLVAHADAAARDADPAAEHGAPVSAAFILQPPPKGDLP